MKITFLGTGTSQGIPVIGSRHEVCLSSDHKDKRLRSSLLLEWNDAVYVIDCGPDFRQQILRVGLHHLSGILFTHFHADHTAGLDVPIPVSFLVISITIMSRPSRVFPMISVRAILGYLRANSWRRALTFA